MVRFRLIALFLVVLSSSAFGQKIIAGFDEEVGQTTTVAVAAENGEVYSVFIEPTIGFRNAIIHTRRWNGLFWVDLPDLPITDFVMGPENQLSAFMHQDQLHILGSFQLSLGAGAVKWNGFSWEVVAGGIRSTFEIHEEISITDAAAFEGSIFTTGEFDWAGGTQVKNLIYLNHTGWVNVDYQGGVVTDVEAVGDTLYVSGAIQKIDGVAVSGIAGYRNKKWFAVTHPFQDNIVALTQLSGELFAVTHDAIWSYNGVGWTNEVAIDVLEVYDAQELNGVLYLSGSFTINNELCRMVSIVNGQVTVMLRDDDVEWNADDEISIEAANDYLYMLGGFRSLAQMPIKNAALTKPGYNLVSGQVYRDNNANCMFDQGDESIHNALISLNSGEYYISTRSDGSYDLFVPNSSQNNLEVFLKENEKLTCGLKSRAVLAEAFEEHIIEDFAITENPGPAKVNLMLSGESGFKVKHGYEGRYQISVACEDPSQYPMTLEFIRDVRLKSYTTSLVPAQSSNSKMKWVLQKDRVIDLEFPLDPLTISMGDTLVFETIVRSNNEAAAGNRNLIQEVVSAYDPNDKQCNKEEIALHEEDLTYHIRFQNLGTDNARNVRIVDTIDNQLPIEFIQILNNSHYERYASAYKVRGHAIVWSFDGIELPPVSAAGEHASSGFVTFECGLSNDLFVGQRIENKAHIYFDYQPPVITNTVESEVVEDQVDPQPDFEGFRLYPNPATEQIRLESEVLSVRSYEVFGVNGAKLYENRLAVPVRDLIVPIANRSEGVYYLRIEHNLGVEVMPFLVDRAR